MDPDALRLVPGGSEPRAASAPARPSRQPRSPRQPRRPLTRSRLMRTAPRALILLLVLTLAFGCNKPKSSSSAPAETPKPVATLTAEQLLSEYQMNEVGA